MSRKRKNPTELEGSKVPFSFKKHILPPLSGVMMMLFVFSILNFQQFYGTFNSPKLNAYAPVADRKIEAAPVDVNAPSKIIVNSVSIEAPIQFGQTTINETNFQLALRDGVVHYPNTARPGETGNVVLFGHSSQAWWAKGNYKFVFAPLHDVVVGDKIFIEYQGTRYSYEITGTRVVQPEDVSVLKQGKDKRLTLITCTPIGTDKQRLIVDAKQLPPATTLIEFPKQTRAGEFLDLPGTRSAQWDVIEDVFSGR